MASATVSKVWIGWGLCSGEAMAEQGADPSIQLHRSCRLSSITPHLALAWCGLDTNRSLREIVLLFLKNYFRLRRHSRLEVVQSWPILQPLLSLMALNLKRNCRECSRSLRTCKGKTRKKRDKFCANRVLVNLEVQWETQLPPLETEYLALCPRQLIAMQHANCINHQTREKC